MARPQAPSPCLLRYLRAQECFTFTSSSTTPSRTPKRHFSHTQPRTVSRPARRNLTTFTPSFSVPIESSCFPSFSWSQKVRLSPARCDEPANDAPSRSLSTGARKNDEHDARLSRLLGFNRRKPREPLQPDDLPSLAQLHDNGATGRIVKPASLKLRCTEFDDQGNVVLNNGEFKKSELIAKYGLLPRDLRKIDSSLLPNILVRPSAILINLLHLRVLIKHDRVLVFDAFGSSDTYTQSLFMHDLESKLRSPEQRTAGSSQAGGALPYEFRALESVLVSVTTGLEGEFDTVREPVVRVLRELEEDIDRDQLRHLLIYSKKLSSFEQKARLVRDAIDDLLEADDDLAAMYLTDKTRGRPRGETEHTEVEMLLESYYRIADEIFQSTSNLVANIRNTEEIVKAILDANRNALMLLELKFTIWALGLGGGTFIASLYGMNLENFIEDTPWGMGAVVAASVAATVFLMRFGQRKLDRVTRISMWGKASGGPRAGAARRREEARANAELARRQRLKGWEEGRVVAEEGQMGRPLGPGREAKA